MYPCQSIPAWSAGAGNITMEDTVDKAEKPAGAGADPPAADPPSHPKDVETEDETSNASALPEGSAVGADAASGLLPAIPIKKKRSQTRTRDEGSAKWKGPVLDGAAPAAAAAPVEVKLEEVGSEAESEEVRVEAQAAERPGERRLAKPGATINGKGPLQVCSICGFKSRHGPALTAHQKGHKNEKAPRVEKRKHKLLVDVVDSERSERMGVKSEQSDGVGASDGEVDGEEVTQDGGGKGEARGANVCNICNKKFKNDKALFGHKGRVHSNHKQELEKQAALAGGPERKVRRRGGEGKGRKRAASEEGRGSEEYVSAEENELSGEEGGPGEENEQMEMLQAAEVLMAVGFFKRDDDKKEAWKKGGMGEKATEEQGKGKETTGPAEKKSEGQNEGKKGEAEPAAAGKGGAEKGEKHADGDQEGGHADGGQAQDVNEPTAQTAVKSTELGDGSKQEETGEGNEEGGPVEEAALALPSQTTEAVEEKGAEETAGKEDPKEGGGSGAKDGEPKSSKGPEGPEAMDSYDAPEKTANGASKGNGPQQDAVAPSAPVEVAATGDQDEPPRNQAEAMKVAAEAVASETGGPEGVEEAGPEPPVAVPAKGVPEKTAAAVGQSKAAAGTTTEVAEQAESKDAVMADADGEAVADDMEVDTDLVSPPVELEPEVPAAFEMPADVKDSAPGSEAAAAEPAAVAGGAAPKPKVAAGKSRDRRGAAGGLAGGAKEEGDAREQVSAEAMYD